MGRAAGRRLHKVMTPVTLTHNPPATPDTADMHVPDIRPLK